MKLFFKLIFVTLIISPALSYADTIYGIGGRSCGAWIEARTKDDYFDMGQWMLGYISAHDELYTLRQSDSKAFSVYLDNYCRQNPLDSFKNGVNRLAKDLRANR